MKHISTLALLAISVLLFSCRATRTNPFDVFKPIDASAVNALQKGTTTRSDVLKQFGTPLDRVQTDSSESYLYRYFDDSLRTEFSKNELLTSYTFSPEAFQIVKDNSGSKPKKFTSGRMKKIKPGFTTATEVGKILGDPTYVYKGVDRNKLIYQRDSDKITFYYQRKSDLVINYYRE